MHVLVTRYLSEETLTRMRSSPTRTFSPSDLCLLAGWIVHQHASPVAHNNNYSQMFIEGVPLQSGPVTHTMFFSRKHICFRYQRFWGIT